MSFCKLKSIIEEGDTVVIYLSPKQMYPVKVDRQEVFQTRFGAIRMDELIGKNYGCRVECSKGFVHILDMTPELWTLTLPHRTQILYGPDIAMILMYLQLKSGSKVVEAGTGSGSLSHSIARTISPNGKLYTFDFHEERAMVAREEFQQHGLSSIIQADHRDVCQDGFPMELNKSADAVFLDLPHPWEAIESAQKVLKNNGKICCFSPCIEQVQKSCQQLNRLNFLDIETFECVLRPYEVRQYPMKKIDFDALIELSTNEEDTEQEECSQNKEEMEDSRLEEESSDNNNNKRLKLNEEEEEEMENDNMENKQQKKNERINNNNNHHPNDQNKTNKLKLEKCESTIDYWVTYMNTEIAGHTGFLTFATNFSSLINNNDNVNIETNIKQKINENS